MLDHHPKLKKAWQSKDEAKVTAELADIVKQIKLPKDITTII